MPVYRTPGDGKLHYEVHGSGPVPMLMLHGLSQSSVTFKGLIQALLPGRSLYLCDLPGHGQSYRPAQYLADNMVNDVAGLLRDVIGKPTIVYGHSLGSLMPPVWLPRRAILSVDSSSPTRRWSSGMRHAGRNPLSALTSAGRARH